MRENGDRRLRRIKLTYMNQKERRNSMDSSRREHGNGFVGLREQRGSKSLFQLALEASRLLHFQT